MGRTVELFCSLSSKRWAYRLENVFNRVRFLKSRLSIRIVNRPFARHVLSILRSKNTDQVTFRKNLVKLGRILGYEIADDLGFREVLVETPMGKANGVVIDALENVVIINVLRAATPLVEGLLKAFPSARQGVVVARRRETEYNAPPSRMDVDIYYSRIPSVGSQDTVIVADPMVATGSTILRVLELIRAKCTPSRLYIASVIASKQGVDALLSSGYTIRLYAVEVDPVLNNKGYIIPGLGDAGDRAFG